MRSVVVICMDFMIGSGARALVDRMLADGFACEVICPHGDEPVPAHVESGRVRVHRVAPRRGSGGMGFAALVARRVHELQLGKRCDRVVCIDAGWCAEVLRGVGLSRAVEIREHKHAGGIDSGLDRWCSLESTLIGHGSEALS